MSGLADLLAIDTARLDAKIGTTRGSGSFAISLRIDSPLDLLGGAGEAIRSIETIANDPGDLPASMVAGLGKIAALVPFGNIPELAHATSVLSELRDRLAPLRELSELNPRAMLNRVLSESGGLDGLFDNLTGQISSALTGELPAALEIPLAALRDLSGGKPQSGEQVASFFARFLLGLDLDTIREPWAILDGLRVQISGGAEATALEARLHALRIKVDAAGEALLGRAPDMLAILTELRPIRAEIDLLTGSVLPEALTALTLDLTAIRPADLTARLDGALAPLIAQVPVPPKGLADFILPPLRALGDGIDDLTAAALDQFFTETEAKIRATFAASEVSRLRDETRNLLAGVVGFLDTLPLAALRNRLTQALLGLEGKIAELASFSPVADLGAKMLAVSDAIDGIDLSAVSDKIDQLAGVMRDAVDAFPIEEIRDELASLQASAADAVAQLPPLIEELRVTIAGFAEQIVNVDLSGASVQAVGVVRSARDALNQALDGADLPAAALAPLGLLAGEVRKIDLSTGISGELGKIVARIDLGPALGPVQEAIDRARDALAKLSPAALLETLDAEFDKVAGALATVSPDALVAQLSAGFREAAGQIDRIDPTTLIKPLQVAFDQAIDAARVAADPAPLLAPLTSLYREIEGILDLLDPIKLLGPVVGEVTKLPMRLSAATADAVNQKLGGEAGGPLIEAPLGKFKFGDIVRPLALLVGEARSVVRDASEDALTQGLALLSEPLALLVRGGRTAGGHLEAIAAELSSRRGLVDAAAGGALGELRAALDRLARIEAGLAAGGRSSLQLNAAVVSVQLDTHVIVSFPGRERLAGAVAKLEDGLAAPELGASFRRLGNLAGSFFPEELALPGARTAILDLVDTLFDRIDPTPVADELDAIGAKLQAKFMSFAQDLARRLFRIWNTIFEELEPLMPQSIMSTLGEVTKVIRRQLSALDPVRLEAELKAVLDAVVATLEAFSPVAFAGTLTGTFDALKAKLNELDPATLLGDLDPLRAVIAEFEALRPTLVLAPLAAQAQAVDAALQGLLSFDPAAIVTGAIVRLEGEIELVVQDIEVELDGFLGDIETAGGGSGGGSESISATVG